MPYDAVYEDLFSYYVVLSRLYSEVIADLTALEKE
jgi:hypothetical protein